MLVIYILSLYQSCPNDFPTQKEFIATGNNKYTKEKDAKQIIYLLNLIPALSTMAGSFSLVN